MEENNFGIEELSKLRAYKNDLNELVKNGFENMGLKELNDLIDNLIELRNNTSELNNSVSEVIANKGDYDVDAIRDFNREFSELANDIDNKTIEANRFKTNMVQTRHDDFDKGRELKADMFTLEGQLKRKQNQVEENNKRIDEIKADLERNITNVNTINEKLKDLRADPEKNAAQINLYITTLNEINRTVADLNFQLNNLIENNKILNDEIQNIQNQLNNKQEQVDVIDNNIKTINDHGLNEAPKKVEEQAVKDTSHSIFDIDKNDEALKPTEDTPTYATNDDILNGEKRKIGNEDYILILDEEETLRKYSEQGFDKNADGDYFNPWIDDYDKDYNPLEDPEFMVYRYYKKERVLNEAATLQKYANEGFGKNAFGEYFNPWTDDYDKDYNPLEDPGFQVFDEKYVLVNSKRKNGKIKPINVDDIVPTKKDKTDDGKDKTDDGKDKTDDGKDKTDDDKDKTDDDKDKTDDDKDKTDDDIPVIDLDKDQHTVTLNIKRPDGKKMQIAINVNDGSPVLTGENKLLIDEQCKLNFGNDCDHYEIESENFDLKNTPITEDKEITADATKICRVVFKNKDDQVSLLLKEGQYINPNFVERMTKAVNYGYNLGSDSKELDKAEPVYFNYLEEFHRKKDKDASKIKNLQGTITGKLKKSKLAFKGAFTGLKYWGSVTTNGNDEEIEKFKFNKPITGNVVLEAQTGIKAKSVVATVAGTALGAGVAALTPVGGMVATAGGAAIDKIAKYKLNHHQAMESYDEIYDEEKKLTAIKKGSALLKNHFRETQTIKNLQYFARGVILGSAAVNLGRGAKDLYDKTHVTNSGQEKILTNNTGTTQTGATQTGTTQTQTSYSLKSGDQFQYGYRDSYSAIGNQNSVHLNTGLTGQSTGQQLYDTVTHQYLPVNQETLAEAAKDAGRYGVRYMSSNGDTMWESLEKALEITESVGRTM